MEEVSYSISINELDDDALLSIFKWLCPRSIIRCSTVCQRWLRVISDLTDNDSLWHHHCLISYSDICDSAFAYSMPGVNWYQLYKSLSLWNKLSTCEKTIKKIDVTKNHGKLCTNFQVLHDGLIGVLIENSVVYYDVDTLRQIKTFTIADHNNNLMYRENDEFILLLTFTDQLLVRKQSNRNQIVATIADVNIFMSVGNNIYYVTGADILNRCTILDGTYTCTRLVRSFSRILALGYENDCIYVLSYDFTMHVYYDGELHLVPFIHFSTDEFIILKRCNFINNTQYPDQFVLYMHYLFKQDVQFTQSQNFEIIRIHGPVVLVGYKNCVLRIFYSLYNTSLIELLKSQPVLECDLEKYGNKSGNKILNIDVIEGENSQIVLVALSGYIISIKLTYPLYSSTLIPIQDKPSTSGSTQPTMEKPTKIMGILPSDSARKSSTSSEGSSSEGSYIEGLSTSNEEMSISKDTTSTSSGDTSNSSEGSSSGEPRLKKAKSSG